jgi:predicted anti-sigma-YlaC factor YlaD
VLELDQACERFRAFASLRVDGEQTRLEAARQAGHAAHCEDCRAYASELAAITARIRATPAEQLLAPIPLGLHQPAPRRQRTLRPVAHAVAALALVLLIAQGRDDAAGPGLAQPRLGAAYFQSMDYERQLQRALRRQTSLRGTRKAV